MPLTEQLSTLLILTPGFPENESDTGCLPFLQSLVRNLKRESPALEIIILTFQYPDFKGNYNWHDFQVKSFGGRGGARLKRLYLWIKVWLELGRLKKEKKNIGLFSLWCTECALVGHYFSKLHKLKHFTWICGQDAKKENRYVKRIRPAAHELIAMSDFLQKEFYKNHGIRPAHLIPDGIDPGEFSIAETSPDIDILGMGSLIPLKQYDLFVNIVHTLKNTFPGIKTVLCGKGPERERIISLIQNLNLKDEISICADLPYPEVLRLMQRTRIFLHTSNYEGLGIVCLEALYAGAQVVSFTKPFDRKIEHWHHVNDPDEMVQKIIELMKDTEITHSTVLPYSAKETAKQILALFQ